MNIQILHLLDGAKQAKGLTVIIDVFRAFTVETYLMRNNAAKIIPVSGVDFAFEYKAQHPDAILCGERKGIKIEGFDYGNSPSQIEHVDFTGKTVIHTTSAGTQGIANAIHADEIIGGNLVSAKAIAAYIRKKNPETVSLVCMGLAGGRMTDEDELCGAYIKSLLEGAPTADMDQRMKRIMYTDGAKFFEEARQAVFPERDFHLCTDLNSCNFILRLKKDPETGLDCMERVDVDVNLPEAQFPITHVEPGDKISKFTKDQAAQFPDNVIQSVVYGDYQEPEGNFQAALVLGGNPKVLKSRAETAAKLYKEGRCSLFIPTGGVKWATEFGYLSECQTITRYMLELGVPEACIIAEDTATTTKENMAFCRALLATRGILSGARIAVISSRMHVRRATALARHYIPEADLIPVAAYLPWDNAEDFLTYPGWKDRIIKECKLMCSYVHQGIVPDFTVL